MGTMRVANSTPIVDFSSDENELRVNRDSRFDLPTPESPAYRECVTVHHEALPHYQHDLEQVVKLGRLGRASGRRHRLLWGQSLGPAK